MKANPTRIHCHITKMEPITLWNIEDIADYLEIIPPFSDKIYQFFTRVALNKAEYFLDMHIRPKHVLCEVTNSKPLIEVTIVPVAEVYKVELLLDDGKSKDITKTALWQMVDDKTIKLAPELHGCNLNIQYLCVIPQLPEQIKMGILLHLKQMYDAADAVAENEEVTKLYLPFRKTRL